MAQGITRKDEEDAYLYLLVSTVSFLNLSGATLETLVLKKEGRLYDLKVEGNRLVSHERPQAPVC